MRKIHFESSPIGAGAIVGQQHTLACSCWGCSLGAVVAPPPGLRAGPRPHASCLLQFSGALPLKPCQVTPFEQVGPTPRPTPPPPPPAPGRTPPRPPRRAVRCCGKFALVGAMFDVVSNVAKQQRNASDSALQPNRRWVRALAAGRPPYR